MSIEAFTGKFMKSSTPSKQSQRCRQLRRAQPSPAEPRRLHNSYRRAGAGAGAAPEPEHHRGRGITGAEVAPRRGITGTTASPRPGHDRDQGMTETGASPEPEHHRGRGITATGASPGHHRDLGIVGAWAAPGPRQHQNRGSTRAGASPRPGHRRGQGQGSGRRPHRVAPRSGEAPGSLRCSAPGFADTGPTCRGRRAVAEGKQQDPRPQRRTPGSGPSTPGSCKRGRGCRRLGRDRGDSASHPASRSASAGDLQVTVGGERPGERGRGALPCAPARGAARAARPRGLRAPGGAPGSLRFASAPRSAAAGGTVAVNKCGGSGQTRRARRSPIAAEPARSAAAASPGRDLPEHPPRPVPDPRPPQPSFRRAMSASHGNGAASAGFRGAQRGPATPATACVLGRGTHTTRHTHTHTRLPAPPTVATRSRRVPDLPYTPCPELPSSRTVSSPSSPIATSIFT